MLQNLVASEVAVIKIALVLLVKYMTLLFILISLAGDCIYRLINKLAVIVPDAVMLLEIKAVVVVIDA